MSNGNEKLSPAQAASSESQWRIDARNHANVLLDKMPPGQWGEVRFFFEKKTPGDKGASFWIPTRGAERAAQIENALDQAEIQFRAGKAIYFSQNARAIPVGEKSSVNLMSAVYADVDLYHSDKTLDDLLAYIEAESGLPEPSLLVCSGNGYQAVWFITPNGNKDAWRDAQKRAQLAFKDFGAGLEVVKDEARVLRLSGFANRKNPADPKPTGIVRLNDREPMQLSEFLDAFKAFIPPPSAKAKKNGQPPEFLPEGGTATEAGRNTATFKEAIRLRKIGYHRPEIQALIEVFNQGRCQPPLDDDELNSILNSAEKYEGGNDVALAIAQVQRETTAGGKQRTLRALQERGYEVKESIITGAPRGYIVMVSARPDAGKTTMMRNTAAHLAAGKPFLDIVTKREPRKVLYVDFECDYGFVLKDFESICSGFEDDERELVRDNVTVICTDELEEELGYQFILSNENSRRWLEVEIEKLQPDVIFIDTFRSAFAVQNESDPAEIQKWMTELHNFARKADAALIFSHHAGKAQESGNRGNDDADGLFHFAGSSSFVGRPVLSFTLINEGSGINARTTLKPGKRKFRHEGAIAAQVLKLNPVTRTFESDTPRTAAQQAAAQDDATKVGTLLSEMASGTATEFKTDVIQAALEQRFGIKRTRALKALSEAVNSGVVVKPRYGYYALAPTESGAESDTAADAGDGKVVSIKRPSRAELSAQEDAKPLAKAA